MSRMIDGCRIGAGDGGARNMGGGAPDRREGCAGSAWQRFTLRSAAGGTMKYRGEAQAEVIKNR